MLQRQIKHVSFWVCFVPVVRPNCVNKYKNTVQIDDKVYENNTRKSKGFWEKKENIQNFISKLGGSFNLTTLEDWKSLTIKQINLIGGKALLNKYSLYEIQCMGFPSGKEHFSTPKKSIGFWENEENVQKYLNELKIKLKLNSFDDWNSLTQKDIRENQGSSLLNKYSLHELKCIGYPNGKFKFTNSPEFWKKKKNIDDFINEITNHFNLKSYDDWNLISKNQIEKVFGSQIFQHFSLHELKCLGYPNGELFFDKKPGYWNKKENVEIFLLNLKGKLNLNTPSDWNLITSTQIKYYGGSSLLRLYSIYDLKCMGCPEGKLLFDKPIQQRPSGFWDKEENIRNFLLELKEILNIQTSDDWLRISNSQISANGGGGLISKYSKDKILRKYVPSVNLSKLDVISNRSSQRFLFLQIQKLFPQEEIVEDYYHSEISRKSSFAVQFDVYLVKKKIAFEYQGKHHYEDIPSFGPVELYKQRDKEKINLCNEYGIKLIIIPYSWDNTIESLQNILKVNMLHCSKPIN